MLNGCFRTGRIIVDSQSKVSIYSRRPIGFGRDGLKWQIPIRYANVIPNEVGHDLRVPRLWCSAW